MATRKLKKKAIKKDKIKTAANEKPVRISRTRKQFVPFAAPTAKPKLVRRKFGKKELKKTVFSKVQGGKITKRSKKEIKGKVEKERKVGNDRLEPRVNVREYKANPFIFGNDSPVFVSRSCLHRDSIRALKRKDINEFKKVISNKNFQFYDLDRAFSYGVPDTAHSVALLSGDVKFMDKYFAERDKIKKRQNDVYYEEPNLLKRKFTGSANFHMIGRATRAIQMSRGAKEGNNALLNYECATKVDVGKLLVQRGIDCAILEKISKTSDADVNNIQTYVYEAVRMGHRELASKMIDIFVCFGDFNELHKLSLANKKPPTKLLAASVKKKAHFNRDIMPLHTAAISDNIDFLKEMRQLQPVLNQCDSDNWTTIHYAAVAEKPAALKYLISIDTPVVVLNKQLETPLHCAARAGRAENVKILLDWICKYEKSAKKEAENDDNEPPSKKSKISMDAKSIVNYKDKIGRTALHLAVQFERLDVVSVLLANPKTDVEAKTHAGNKKITPLGIACQSGQLEMSKFLIESGNALIESKDKLHRSPLLLAVMNGQDHVVAYLLKKGADLHKSDSSGNAPSHYAAAYGFLSTLKLLAEVDPSCLASENDWKLTPLSVAYLKGNYGLVSWMLDSPYTAHVDINCKDNEGVTLISSLFSYCNTEFAHRLPDQIRFLIDRGTDCSIVDASGNSPLHIFAQIQIIIGDKKKNRITSDQYLECVDLLLNAGADPNARNFAGQTAFQTAIQSGNMVLAEYLYENAKHRQALVEPWTENSNILFDIFALPFIVCRNKKFWSSENGPSINQYNIMPLIDSLFKEDPIKAKEWLWQAKENTETLTPVIQLVTNYTMLGPKSTKKGLAPVKDIHDMALEVLWSVLEFDPDCLIQSGPILKDGQTSLVHMAIEGCGLDRKGDHPFITRVLEAAHNNGKLLEILSIRDNHLRTPLQYAIGIRDEDTTALILEFTKKHRCTHSVHNAVFQEWEEIGGKATSVLKSILHLCVEAEMFTAIKSLELSAAEWKITDRDPSLVLTHRVSRGNSAWHYACRKLNQNTVPLLKILKEPPSERNNFGQTPLHLAIDAETFHSADAFLEPIEYIMDHIDANAKDDQGRTALHHTLLKTGEDVYTVKTTCDPIAVISLLLSKMNKYAITTPDNDGNTVLHLAAVRDANVSAITLMRHGCEVSVENNDGNTPLGLAVLHKRSQTALTLMQANSDVQAKVYGPMPTPTKVSEWSLRNEVEQECQMVTNIPGLVVKNEWHSIVFVILDLVNKKSTVVIAELLHAALTNGQHNFSLYLLKLLASVLKRNEENSDILYSELLHAFVSGNAEGLGETARKVFSSLLELDVPIVDKKGNSQVLVDAAAKGNWDLIKFIKDDVGRGAIAWKKLSDACFAQILAGLVEFWIKSGEIGYIKTAIEVLCTRHAILSMPASYKFISPFPLSHKKHSATQQCSPVIRAIQARKPDLIVFLLSHGFATPTSALLEAVQTNDRAVVKAVCDLEVETMENIDQTIEYVIRHKPTQMLFGARTAMNSKPALVDADVSDSDDDYEDDDSGDDNEDKGSDENTDESSNKRNLNGFSTDFVREKDLSISEEPKKEKALKLFLKNKEIKFDFVNDNGRNVFHYLCEPVGWQNVTMLKALYDVNPTKAKHLIVEKADTLGETVIALAAKLHQRKLLAEMNKLCKVQVKCHTQRHDVSSLVSKYDIDKDAHHYMQKVENENMQTDTVEESVDNRVPHRLSDYQHKGEIVMCDVTNQLFKMVLSRSDIQYGLFGFHNFYRMELIKRKDCDLFILFTNWGRIGDENGQHQTTPFNSLEKGMKEFKTVFRQKTGQDWVKLENFQEIPGKYKLVKTSTAPSAVCDLPIEIHSHPTEDKVYNFIKDISNVKSLQEYSKTVKMGYQAVNNPFGKISKETILKAHAVLEKIRINIKECEKVRATHKVNMEKFLELLNEQRSLTSEYFSLIPMGGFEWSALPIIDNERLVLQFEKGLDDMSQMEIAGRVLAAASWRNKECDSIRYIEYALECDFRSLAPNDEVSQRILQYISCSTKAPIISGILEIACKEPYERYEQHINDQDQVFLWHGTRAENLISILRHGLVAVPSNSLLCAQVFGKGVYFADAFAKSDGYCHYSAGGLKYMLLCQVAPGKTIPYGNVSNVDESCETVFFVGEKGPDRTNDVWIDGVAMPCGRLVKMPQKNDFYIKGSWNEYIVKERSRCMPRYIIMYK